MILSPPIQNSTMLMITVECLAAEMATLPYSLHTFGQMSVIGLLADTLSRWPGVFHKHIGLSGLMTIELYAVVGFIWACLYFKKPPKDRIITDKNSNLVALTERMHII